MFLPRFPVRILIPALLLWQLPLSAASRVDLESFRYWTHTDYTRVVFELSGKVRYQIMRVPGPERLVIDIEDAAMKTDIPSLISGHEQLKSIRSASRNGDDLRVVLDLKNYVSPRSFLLPPKVAGDPYRLAIDLYPVSAKAPVTTAEETKPAAPVKSEVVRTSKPVTPVKTIAPAARDIIVAIDAGHGGHDPGARGPRGTHEKDIVLQIAQKLARLVSQQPGMKPVLIRSRDEFVELRDRQLRARASNADMFISIHADAFVKSNVHGSSVFVLSNKGASSETAKWLARKENAGYQLAGIDMVGRDPELKEVLLDLSMTATREASQQVAKAILSQLGQVGTLHQSKVQHAGFAVLKSPDIPSVLVETAFISNPREESRLRTASYQNTVARAILNGVVEYFSVAAPPGTRMALSRKHVIAKGETLSEIADRYGVTTRQLQASNSLRGTRIRIGQVLEIPAGS